VNDGGAEQSSPIVFEFRHEPDVQSIDIPGLTMASDWQGCVSITVAPPKSYRRKHANAVFRALLNNGLSLGAAALVLQRLSAEIP